MKFWPYEFNIGPLDPIWALWIQYGPSEFNIGPLDSIFGILAMDMDSDLTFMTQLRLVTKG